MDKNNTNDYCSFIRKSTNKKVMNETLQSTKLVSKTRMVTLLTFV